MVPGSFVPSYRFRPTPDSAVIEQPAVLCIGVVPQPHLPGSRPETVVYWLRVRSDGSTEFSFTTFHCTPGDLSHRPVEDMVDP